MPPFTKRDQQLARVILAQKQLRDINVLFAAHAISFIPIKGVTLIDELYADPAERFCEDIDLLVRPHDLIRIHTVLETAGYLPRPDDPLGWMPCSVGLPIDLHTGIWYMGKAALTRLWQNTRLAVLAGTHCRLMPREDALVLCLMHGLIHHADPVGPWQRELCAMLDRWQTLLNPTHLRRAIADAGAAVPVRTACGLLPAPYGDRLATLTRMNPATSSRGLVPLLLAHRHPLTGHVLRALVQQNTAARLVYAWTAAFPPPYVLKRRYGIRTLPGLLAGYTVRPLLLAGKAAALVGSVCVRSVRGCPCA